jgi:alpha-beta hydrolase superfamily lysophospholipase
LANILRKEAAPQIGEYIAGDGLALRYRLWPGEQESDALVFLHGIESHSEWFSECADEIAGAGMAVYAPDRRGSGMNEQARGRCPGFSRLLDDVRRFADSIKKPNRRLHLAALSWGAKLAVALDMLHPGLFCTMTLIAPGIFSRVTPPVGERARIAFNALFRPEALHPIPIKDEMFTAVPEYLRYIAGDPLRLRKVTARFYLESVRLDRLLKSRQYQWTSPTLMLLAGDDSIVDSRRLEEMFERLRMERKEVRIYSERKHSLQFESPGQVAKDILSWTRSGASAPA